MSQTTTVQKPMRLDQFLASHFGFSRAQAVKHIEAGLVHCNGVVARKSAKRLKVGEIIICDETRGLTTKSEKQRAKNDILFSFLYEDPACFVVNKPVGIAVHAAQSLKKDENSLIDLLRAQRSSPTLALVHRLDRGTTGCLLIAKNPVAAEELQKQFKDRSVAKEYLAIVAGIPREKEATVEAAIGRSLVDRTRMSLFRTGASRSALTHYRILDAGKDASLLLCRIETGRTHQIRVHLRAIGHPILGDEKYGNEQSRRLSKDYGLDTPALHAWHLTFRSPKTHKEVHVTAPIPETFQKNASELGLSIPQSEEEKC